MPHRAPRRPGRPTKLTPDIQRRIVKAVRRGAHFEAACEAAGVGVSTAYRWLATGEDLNADRRFREFREAITRARAKAEADMVKAVIDDARGGAVVKHLHRVWRNGTVEDEYQYAPPNGRVALEYLARVHPDRWGRRAVEVTGPGGGAVQVSGEIRGVVIGMLADRLHETLQSPVVRGELESGDGDAAVAS